MYHLIITPYNVADTTPKRIATDSMIALYTLASTVIATMADVYGDALKVTEAPGELDLVKVEYQLPDGSLKLVAMLSCGED